jgi:hypothetical protein
MQTSYYIFFGFLLLLAITLIILIKTQRLKDFRDNLSDNQEVKFIDNVLFKQFGIIVGFELNDTVVIIMNRNGSKYYIERKNIFPLKKRDLKKKSSIKKDDFLTRTIENKFG